MRKKLELYIHIPFCAKKCGYCDFLSGPAAVSVQQRYVEQLIEEIACQSAHYPGYQVPSVYLGGGTPSLLGAKDICQIMEQVKSVFELSDTPEVTIEANPGTVTMEKLKAWSEAGINRVSIGLQSADDKELKNLGRIHTYDEFLKTYQRVRQAGFDNVNIDLMSALPGQTLASWRSTLKKVARLKPEHISAYSLTIEEGTPFYQQYHGHPELLPGEDEEREMYYATKQILQDMGFRRYEISNYAKSGRECRHNIGYWTGTEYLGLGLGSSSYIQGFRFHNEEDLGRYCRIRMKGEDADDRLHQDIIHLTDKEKMEEFMFLGLRMMDGVSGSEFLKRFGVNMWNVYGDVLGKLVENHLIQADNPYIRLTDFGVDISNYVLSEFLL
ncbi:MAG: oxygen-independent coproporphyrinogen III oxidase [Hungatella sp.]|nr:oxygen-independent coproporphyrinogen III oxidase [Hungatella sp.]MCI9635745.1 oxygen-independent coproporphyrinogen III oxidase [Hungatella sp.]